jgi:hypothetical protein
MCVGVWEGRVWVWVWVWEGVGVGGAGGGAGQGRRQQPGRAGCMLGSSWVPSHGRGRPAR